jgi:UDP-glucose 4-epimerase
MAAVEGRQALLPRPIVRDWIYAPDMADGIISVLDAPALGHRLYNISPGETWSILDFGRALAAHYPGFECRLAAPSETATVDPHAPSDRAPLSADRIRRDLGWGASTTMDAAALAYVAWWRMHGRHVPALGT